MASINISTCRRCPQGRRTTNSRRSYSAPCILHSCFLRKSRAGPLQFHHKNHKEHKDAIDIDIHSGHFCLDPRHVLRTFLFEFFVIFVVKARCHFSIFIKAVIGELHPLPPGEIGENRGHLFSRLVPTGEPINWTCPNKTNSPPFVRVCFRGGGWAEWVGYE